uniref:POP5 homolog, ribonuclease P/MRP subunit n=1 Tax=Malurus cyaneus samueli TaxID=2593467 RepID=A0A8C5TZP4_9PASS
MVRFKNRYVLCEVVSEDPRCRQCIEDRALQLAVRDAITRVHGDYGLACCSISFTGTIRTCQKFLIRYNRTQLLRLLQNCTNEESPAARPAPWMPEAALNTDCVGHLHRRSTKSLISACRDTSVDCCCF